MCGEGGGGDGALSGDVREMMGRRTMAVGCVMQEEEMPRAWDCVGYREAAFGGAEEGSLAALSSDGTF